MAERAHPEDPSFRGTIYETRLRERYAFCLSYIQNKDVLDVPCGTGWGSSMLSGYALLTGLDIDEGAIYYARTHFPGIQFVEGRMEQLPFGDNSFDVVICLEGLEHLYLTDARKFLERVHRTLRSKGLLILTAPLLNNNRHSTNPYHLYEFTTQELQSLLESYFISETFEIFQGGDSPEVRLVARRRDESLAEAPLESEAHKIHERAYYWLQATRTETGFRFTEGSGQSLLATCFGILLLEGLRKLQDIPTTERNSWSAYLQGCQDADSGLFLDPLLEHFPVESAEHDFIYLSHQMTYFALQALDALGMKALYPLRFMEQFRSAQAIEDWLEKLDWSNAWLQSNRVMFVLAFLIYRAEVEGDRSAPALFHSVLDWLDRNQDPKTGLWGTQYNASLLNAVAATYHFIPFYEYVHRPVLYVKRIIDAVLSLQQADGLFAATPGGGACEDLDAIDLLATFTQQVIYRAEDIKRALVRSHWAIWNLQNADGGFCYARRDTAETYRYSSWAGMEVELRQSDTWATWFRLLALATIRATYPGDLPALGEWQFRRWPALGYHRLLGDKLNSEERAILPLWIRPTAHTETYLDNVPPMISVIIPCYNMGLYLHEAVESVLAQTFPQIEVLILDDGSSDEFTRLLLEHFERPKTRIIHQNNRGLPAARNAGIRQARGRYICCLDADDRLRPAFLERAFAILETQTEVGFVTSHYQTFDGSDEVFRYESCGFPEMLVKNQAMVPALFRREAWERTGGYCETLSGLQDWDFWISILELGYRGVMIPEVLFEYRVRLDSMYATTSLPENFGRLLGQIAERHKMTYSRYVVEVMTGIGIELASLLQLYWKRSGWIATLEQGKAWLEEQWRTWQRLAEERQAWIEELEQGKAWLEEQWNNWQRIAADREQIIREQQAWIGELEQGKAWLEEQWQTWQRIAEEREATIRQQEATIRQQEATIRRVDEYLTKFRLKPLIRLAIRLGFLRLDADEG